MRMAKVVNGQVVATNLPEVETLKNGRIVTGFDKLPQEVLKKEGWFPLEEPSAPEVSSSEVAVDDGFEIFPDKVVKRWKIIPRPKSAVDIRREKIRNARTLEELKAILLEDL